MPSNNISNKNQGAHQDQMQNNDPYLILQRDLIEPDGFITSVKLMSDRSLWRTEKEIGQEQSEWAKIARINSNGFERIFSLGENICELPAVENRPGNMTGWAKWSFNLPNCQIDLSTPVVSSGKHQILNQVMKILNEEVEPILKDEK